MFDLSIALKSESDFYAEEETTQSRNCGCSFRCFCRDRRHDQIISEDVEHQCWMRRKIDSEIYSRSKIRAFDIDGCQVRVRPTGTGSNAIIILLVRGEPDAIDPGSNVWLYLLRARYRVIVMNRKRRGVKFDLLNEGSACVENDSNRLGSSQ